MKEVVITNKVVGRGSVGTTSPASFVNLSAYALKSDLLSFEKTFNDFLQGEDTDNVINRWNELEAFLNGIGEDFNLLSLLGDKADKLYVDSNFVAIETAQSIFGEKNFTGGLKVNGSPIVYNSEKGYWKLEGDLLVTGGVSFYSSDTEYVPSTIMDALILDDSTLGINSDGQLYVKGNLSGGASTLGELSNVGSWANSVADVDRIMYQAAGSSMWVAKSLSSIGGGGVSGDYLPLSGGTVNGILNIGGSDNTSWIPIQFNRGGTTGFIGSSINAIDIGLPTGYLRIGPDYVDYNHSSSERYPILHSGNYSNYALPLSGGTLKTTSGNTPLVLRSSTADSWLAFRDSSDNFLASIGIKDDKQPYIYNGSSYKIWHSGNDGAGSGLDADLLDGYQLNGIASYIMGNNDYKRLSAGTNLNDVGAGFWGTIDNTPYGNAPYDNFGLICMTLNYGYKGQLVLPYDCENRRIAYRDSYYSSGNILWTNWKYVAFTDSNVASATKLQTARTIWGQSFDGTGNVDGILTMTRHDQINGTKGLSLNYASGGLVKTAIWNGQGGVTIYCTSSSNVGIGTTSPQAKLDVNGDFTCKNIWIHRNNEINAYTNYVAGTGTNLHLQYRTTGNTTLCVGGGNVGIGTTSPSSKLHIHYLEYDILKITRSNTNGAGIYFSNSNGELGDIGFHNDTNFVIRNTAHDAKNLVLSQSGNLLTRGGMSMYSDRRKKTILNHVELSLKQIANAPLIEHYYNSDDAKTTHVGSIAQYWANINDWFCKLDNEGYYTMEIQNCALASAISIARELSRYESKTDKTIKQLKKRICQLEEELERLKSA